ncbi:MAG: PKD domain-containing protein, partial [Planctomycetes bacterium]|nr:PKD domain-containing protein [Planctomycetota bacterium]
RPEIFVKGCRNPYRIAVDPKTGAVWWGDVGPDAGDDAHGDPRGVDTLNRADRAAFFGWPFARGGRFYRDRDFGDDVRGESFADLLVNDSPRNTGLERLPSPTPPFFAYPYGRSDALPELMDGGRNAMAGPWVHQSLHAAHFPAWFDRVMLFYDWARATFFWLKFDEAGALDGVHRFLANVSIPHPIDVELATDGSLWILDYGTNWWDNVDGRLLRVRFSSFDKRPRVVADAKPTTGALPLSVRFSSAGTIDPDGDDARLRYLWDFGDGTTSAEASPTHEFTKPGAFDVTLRVVDAAGRDARATVSIVAGNTAPDVKLFAPETFSWDAPLAYTVDVLDVEDGRATAGQLLQDDALRRTELTAVYVESGDPEDAADVEPDPLLPGMDPRAKGTALLKKSGCIACHHPEQPSVGPSYRTVADALRALDEADRPAEITRLIAKVRTGGSGRFGSVAMPPHLHVQDAAIANMVDAIAALGVDDRLRGEAGTLRIPARPESAKDAHGVYVLRASYTDRGAPGVAALTRASEPVVVRVAPSVFELPVESGEAIELAA